MHENFVWNGLFALTTGTGISFEPRELDKQMIVVLSTPHRSRWGNSSRAVNSYERSAAKAAPLARAAAAQASAKERWQKAPEIAYCLSSASLPRWQKPALVQLGEGSVGPFRAFAYCYQDSKLASFENTGFNQSLWTNRLIMSGPTTARLSLARVPQS
jgi:hypothetical protein